MFQPQAHIDSKLFTDPELKPTRDGLGEALLELGKTHPQVVVVCADLSESTRVLAFKEAYPERFVEVGVAEQNLATIASGLAAVGKIPLIASYAAFSPGRNNEQIRTTIALNQMPVKIAGMHAGISVGPDGATHQALEDIALMRVQPHMTVLSPCDAQEARKAVLAAAEHPGPVYIRFAREKTPLLTTASTPFTIGRALPLWVCDHPKVVVFATGPYVHQALKAAHQLESHIPVSVINIHTIKPLDTKAIVAAAKHAGAVVTVEEHQIAGGLGSAIAEVLAQEHPVPMEFIGVRDQFGQSGEPEALMEQYRVRTEDIVSAIEKAARRAHPELAL